MSEASAESPTDRGSSPLVVSACLLGVRCNHQGQASTSEAVVALGERYRLLPVCPETAGGLPTPRPAAELQPDGRVTTGAGTYPLGPESPVAPEAPGAGRGGR